MPLKFWKKKSKKNKNNAKLGNVSQKTFEPNPFLSLSTASPKSGSFKVDGVNDKVEVIDEYSKEPLPVEKVNRSEDNACSNPIDVHSSEPSHITNTNQHENIELHSRNPSTKSMALSMASICVESASPSNSEFNHAIKTGGPQRTQSQNQALKDAQLVQVLLNLGYNESQACAAVQALHLENGDRSHIITSPNKHVNEGVTNEARKREIEQVDNCSDLKLNESEEKTVVSLDVQTVNSALHFLNHECDETSKNGNALSTFRNALASLHPSNSLQSLSSKLSQIVKSKSNEPCPEKCESSASSCSSVFINERSSKRENIDDFIENFSENKVEKQETGASKESYSDDLYDKFSSFLSCGLIDVCMNDTTKKPTFEKPQNFIPDEIYASDGTDSMEDLTYTSWVRDSGNQSVASDHRSTAESDYPSAAESDSDSTAKITSDGDFYMDNDEDSSYAEITIGDQTMKSIRRAQDTLRKHSSEEEAVPFVNKESQANITLSPSKDQLTSSDNLDRLSDCDSIESVKKAKQTLRDHSQNLGFNVADDDLVTIRTVVSIDESKAGNANIFTYLIDTYEVCTGNETTLKVVREEDNQSKCKSIAINDGE